MSVADRVLFSGTDTSSATEALYATWLHEGVHATGHKSRLDRNFSAKFGTQERSAEELVAELGAAFLCADLAVTPHLRDDHAHYVAHWLEIMKGDKKSSSPLLPPPTGRSNGSTASNHRKPDPHHPDPCEPRYPPGLFLFHPTIPGELR